MVDDIRTGATAPEHAVPLGENRRGFGPPLPAGYSVLDDEAAEWLFRLHGGMGLAGLGGGPVRANLIVRVIGVLMDAVRDLREASRAHRSGR